MSFEFSVTFELFFKRSMEKTQTALIKVESGPYSSQEMCSVFLGQQCLVHQIRDMRMSFQHDISRSKIM